MIIEKVDVQVRNVHAECDCGTRLTEDDMDIVWDSGSISTLSDDSFSYKYTCSKCGKTHTSKVKYPHQEFVEI